MARARRGHLPGPARPHQVVEVQRRLLAQGRFGLLLQPLRRTERRGAAGTEQAPEGVLPQARHFAGQGCARLRAPGQARLGIRRRGDRGRPLPAHRAVRGHRQQEPGVRPRPQEARQQDRSVPRRLRRRLFCDRQRRRHVLRPDQQERAALPPRRDPAFESGRGRVEDAGPRGAGHSRPPGGDDGEQPVRGAVDDRRSPRGADVRPRRNAGDGGLAADARQHQRPDRPPRAQGDVLRVRVVPLPDGDLPV